MHDTRQVGADTRSNVPDEVVQQRLILMMRLDGDSCREFDTASFHWHAFDPEARCIECIHRLASTARTATLESAQPLAARTTLYSDL